MSLNDNQRRALAVTLRHLEETLANIERVMNHDEYGILYRRVASFTPPQRAQMERLIQTMREEIRRAALTFDLPIEEQNVARYIAGTLALTWEMLEEMRPRKLGNYGNVDDALEATLEPVLERLMHLLFQISAVARGEELRDEDH